MVIASIFGCCNTISAYLFAILSNEFFNSGNMYVCMYVLTKELHFTSSQCWNYWQPLQSWILVVLIRILMNQYIWLHLVPGILWCQFVVLNCWLMVGMQLEKSTNLVLLLHYELHLVWFELDSWLTVSFLSIQYFGLRYSLTNLIKIIKGNVYSAKNIISSVLFSLWKNTQPSWNLLWLWSQCNTNEMD